MQRIYTNEYEVTEYLIGGSIIKYPMKFSSKDSILKHSELRMSSGHLNDITIMMVVPTEMSVILYPENGL